MWLSVGLLLLSLGDHLLLQHPVMEKKRGELRRHLEDQASLGFCKTFSLCSRAGGRQGVGFILVLSIIHRMKTKRISLTKFPV